MRFLLLLLVAFSLTLAWQTSAFATGSTTHLATEDSKEAGSDKTEDNEPECE